MIPFLTEPDLPPPDWEALIAALAEGHRMPPALVDDAAAAVGPNTVQARVALVPGLGAATKTFTVRPANPARGLPTVQGVMVLFDADAGAPAALIDSAAVTNRKTVADSLLGARLLARPDARTLAIVGTGSVARALIGGYAAAFPQLAEIRVWGREPAKAAAVAALHPKARPAPSLAEAVRGADVISAATASPTPLIEGADIDPGAHVDLIGAYRADMREADDTLLRRGRLFVDSRETTIGRIGELVIPMAAGVISAADVQGDLYDLVQGRARRCARDEITVYKNGGGAHLDLMIATALLAGRQSATAEQPDR